MRLQFAGIFSTGDAVLDRGLRDLEIIAQAGGVRLYAATSATGGITAWDLIPGGAPREIDRQYFPGWMRDDITGLAELLQINGAPQLVLGNVGGTALLAYGVDAAGRIGSLGQIGTLGTTAGRISDIAADPDGTALYLADAGAGTLRTHNGPAGQSTDAFSIVGDGLLATARPGGLDMLVMAEPGRQGVTSYSIDAASGQLTPVANFGLEEGLGIGVPTALEVVQAYGQSWVLLAAAQSGSLSVLRLDPAGGLTPVEHLIDGLTTRFGGVQALAVTETQGWVFVVAGGGDDGLSLFTLLPDGRLVHLQSVAHQLGRGLMDITAIEAERVGNEIQIFVASDDQAGLARFVVPLGQLGVIETGQPGAAAGQRLQGGSGNDMLSASRTDDTLLGGAGDDILVGGRQMTGGTGADIFMPDYGAGTTWIRDFNPAVDRLDLSEFPMLRDPAQLQITPTAQGARIVYRDAVVNLTSANGSPIQANALFGSAFDWADRVLVLGAQVGMALRGSPGGEFIGGSNRADTIAGNGGPDSLWGRGGNDVLSGGWGADSLGGQDGNDTLMGEDGNDMLAGGLGDDSLNGGAGLDALWGAGGNDILFGFTGSDTLGGGPGNDTIDGGDGLDEIWGGPGHDLVWGSDQNDTIGGFTGDDTLRGGNGNDEIWGSAGTDSLWGGVGDDQIGGGTGNDRVDGEGGNDLIFGGAGVDTVWGGNGNDALYGGSGNDQVSGGNGNDSLWGGAGDDWLSGGAGADIFYFAARSGNERIADFDDGLDRIHIYDPLLSFGALDIRQVGSDARIFLTQGTITLSNMTASDLSAADFDFGW